MKYYLNIKETMKDKEQKLLELLQPKEYKSKIKLYCQDSNFEIKKYKDSLGSLENKSYICRIKITEI